MVDLRHNLGGDNTADVAFVDALRPSRLNRPGRLYLLVGRATFSAAANFATTMDRGTRATFAGEPTGGGVNQYGETREVRLERLPIPLLVPVPTEYVEAGGPGDRRLAITPGCRSGCERPTTSPAATRCWRPCWPSCRPGELRLG